jgi:hypothetical protein
MTQSGKEIVFPLPIAPSRQGRSKKRNIFRQRFLLLKAES